jgi:hypothetical protein
MAPHQNGVGWSGFMSLSGFVPEEPVLTVRQLPQQLGCCPQWDGWA